MKIDSKLIGVAVGSFIAGYFFSVNRAREYYLDMANAEVYKNKQEFEAQLERAKERLEQRYEEQLREYENELSEQDAKAAETALMSYQTGEVPSSPEEENRPYVISPEMFLESPDDYDQHTLTHYRKDDVLAAAGDEVITPDVRNMWFGGLIATVNPIDGDAIYIQNDRINTVFEILVNNNVSYNEVVHGAGENE